MRSQTTRVITGIVGADGIPQTGGEWSSYKTATGQYAVKLRGSLRLISASVGYFSPTFGGNALHTAANFTLNSFTVTSVAPASGASTDWPFWFQAVVAA